jgi:hypothetical protein
MTHDFDAALREIPALVYGAMLSLAHGGTTEAIIQDEAAACACGDRQGQRGPGMRTSAVGSNGGWLITWRPVGYIVSGA